MSAMKLQKLVYYGQAWSLALRGEPLFQEEIQAWAYGPVVYELFEEHRGKFVVAKLDKGDVSRVDARTQALLDAVISYYGGMDAAKLSDQTHAESPWQEARAGLRDEARSTSIIDTESMRAFYSVTKPPFAWSSGAGKA